MPKISTLAAVATGGLPLVVVAGALVLWNHLLAASTSPSGEFDRVAESTPSEPTPSVHDSYTTPAADPEPVPTAPKEASTSSLVRASSGVVGVQRNATEHFDEASLLSELHELAAADPAKSLRLARQAVDRFPESPNAAEFQWNVVKALFNLGRLDEAKNEARAMLVQYPKSSFTGDVIHHLLNPPPNPREL